MLCYFAHLSVFSHSIFCFWSLTRFFVWLYCQREHAVLFFVCSTKQKSLLKKCAPEHAVSALKPNSFVLKWKRVVSVLSPLSLFSHGGSHMSTENLFMPSNRKDCCGVVLANILESVRIPLDCYSETYSHHVCNLCGRKIRNLGSQNALIHEETRKPDENP